MDIGVISAGSIFDATEINFTTRTFSRVYIRNRGLNYLKHDITMHIKNNQSLSIIFVLILHI